MRCEREAYPQIFLRQTWKQSVPPRGSGWVRSQVCLLILRLRTHPLPRGGTDCFQV